MNSDIKLDSIWTEITKELKRRRTTWTSFDVPLEDDERLLVTVTIVPPDPIAASIQAEQTSWD